MRNKSGKMAIAFKLPEITCCTASTTSTAGHYQPQSPPPSPQPQHSANPVAEQQEAVGGDISVTDSVPRSVVLQQQQQQSIIVPHTATTALVFHPIPPIFFLPSAPSSVFSPPPSPQSATTAVYRPAPVPRLCCPPAVGCTTCRDLQRGALLCLIYLYFSCGCC